MSTFFALSASVVSTYAFSILFGEKIGVRESLIGTISGAVIYGAVAGTCINIGASIAVGILAGFVSALYFTKIYRKLNEKHVYDTMGLFSTLVISFLGTFFVAPIVLKTYYNYSVSLPTLNSTSVTTGSAITNSNTAGWVLVYVGISMGIGLTTSLVINLIMKCFTQTFS